MKKFITTLIALSVSVCALCQKTDADYVQIARQIIIDNVANVTIDAPRRKAKDNMLVYSTAQMIYAGQLLREHTDMSDEELRIALGGAGYYEAYAWAKRAQLVITKEGSFWIDENGIVK
tara:strand:- start:138 stop:494 length:357 start_codon:yes stop_codon:yes gene_type:complete